MLPACAPAGSVHVGVHTGAVVTISCQDKFHYNNYDTTKDGLTKTDQQHKATQLEPLILVSNTVIQKKIYAERSTPKSSTFG